MNITADYYEELGISRELGLEDIKKQLVQLRKDWVNRQAVFPEKANLMIVLLDGADKAFSNEASRANYDKDLEESKRAPEATDQNAQRKANYRRWYDEAVQYYDKNQYDLAKVAIEKAFQYKDIDSEDANLYNLAAGICIKNKEIRQALNHINQAVVFDSKDPNFFRSKFVILEKSEFDDGFIKTLPSGTIMGDHWSNTAKEEKLALEMMLMTATDRKDDEQVAEALDLLAHVWFRKQGSDISKAEEYAIRALATGKNCERSTEILETIKNNRAYQQERTPVEKELNSARENLSRLEQEKNNRLSQLGPQPPAPGVGGRFARGCLSMVLIFWGASMVLAGLLPLVRPSFYEFEDVGMKLTVSFGCLIFGTALLLPPFYSRRKVSRAKKMGIKWNQTHANIMDWYQHERYGLDGFISEKQNELDRINTKYNIKK